MEIAFAVVANRNTPDLRNELDIDCVCRSGASSSRGFKQGECRSSVAAGRTCDRIAGIVGHRHLERCGATIDHAIEVGGVEALQFVQRAAREQGGDHADVRALGRCANQDDQTRLDEWEQRVLLRLRKAMDLVEKEDRAAPIARKAIAGALGDSADVGLAGIDGRELLERRPRARRHDPRQRRLAGAGRSEQNHRADAILLDRATQWPARTDERFLADDKLKIVGSQTLRERRDETSTVVGGGGEEIAHALRSVGGS